MYYRRNRELSKIYNDVMDDVFGTNRNRRRGFRSNLIENEKDFTLDIEVPGLKKEDIKICYENSYLTISAEKKDSYEEASEKTNFLHKEILYGSFSRSYLLEDIDSDNIKASYNDGILNVVLPKKEEITSKKFVNIE